MSTYTAEQIAAAVAESAAAGSAATATLDTDGTMAANSATRVPSQSAVVTYVAGTVAAIPAAGRVFYLDPADASDIVGYYTALVNPSTGVETTRSVAATGTGNNLLASFATEPNVPSTTLVPPGTAGRHFHVATGSSSQVGRLLVEVYTCNADGTGETLIRSGYSASFSGTSPQELIFSLEDPFGYTLTVTTRLVYKVYVARVSGPATCNVTVYFNGTNRASFVTTTILTPSSGLLSILTADEDMLIRRGGAIVRLPVGPEGQALRVIGGLVTWGFVLAASISAPNADAIGSTGTVNNTREAAIGTIGTLV